MNKKKKNLEKQRGKKHWPWYSGVKCWPLERSMFTSSKSIPFNLLQQKNSKRSQIIGLIFPQTKDDQERNQNPQNHEQENPES